jgi:hypothetical protein
MIKSRHCRNCSTVPRAAKEPQQQQSTLKQQQANNNSQHSKRQADKTKTRSAKSWDKTLKKRD